MKYARIVENMALDAMTTDPFTLFTPEVAAQFVTVPDEVENFWTLDNGAWSPPPPAPEPVPQPEPEPTPPPPPILGPLEFKLLFTAQERIAVAEARKTDAIIEDFFSIIDDPRLKEVNMGLPSTIQGVDYLISKGLVDAARREDILAGKFQ